VGERGNWKGKKKRELKGNGPRKTHLLKYLWVPATGSWYRPLRPLRLKEKGKDTTADLQIWRKDHHSSRQTSKEVRNVEIRFIRPPQNGEYMEGKGKRLQKIIKRYLFGLGRESWTVPRCPSERRVGGEEPRGVNYISTPLGEGQGRQVVMYQKIPSSNPTPGSGGNRKVGGSWLTS